MKKKSLNSILALSIVLNLGACSTPNIRQTSSRDNTKVTVTSSTTIDSSSKRKLKEEQKKEITEKSTNLHTAKQKLWDEDKATKLKNFMDNWGEKMKQTYKEYSLYNNVDFYGASLPEIILGNEKNTQMAVNDKIVSAEWSTTGISNSEYSIIDVYSDAETAHDLNKHIYFFAFHNQQPVVLVSMQNQGAPDKVIHFKETENKELKSGFSSIINNNYPYKITDDFYTPDSNYAKFESVRKTVQGQMEELKIDDPIRAVVVNSLQTSLVRIGIIAEAEEINNSLEYSCNNISSKTTTINIKYNQEEISENITQKIQEELHLTFGKTYLVISY